LDNIFEDVGPEPGVPGAFALPPRVEDFVGRASAVCGILSHFDGDDGADRRRACVVSGVAGIGKSALAVELAHFTSAPGRLFSKAVVFVALSGSTDVEALRRGIVTSLEPLVNGASSKETGRNSGAEKEANEAAIPDLKAALQSMQRRLGRVLLLLDDEPGAAQSSGDVRKFLSALLEAAQQLHVLIFSRKAIYDSLGCFKCLNIQLPPLSPAEAAELFLKRIHRPLRAGDLEPSSPCRQPLPRSEALTQLASHPLLRQLQGHPARVRATSEMVTPELRSIFQLCNGGATPCSPGPSVLNSPSTPGFALRAMSVDEEVSGDGGLLRDMSIDATTASPP